METEITQLVRGRNLKELLHNALEDISYGHFRVDNYELSNDGKTIVKGNGTFRLILENEPPIYDKVTNFTFEVNIGTHKDELVVFDEYEVYIKIED